MKKRVDTAEEGKRQGEVNAGVAIQTDSEVYKILANSREHVCAVCSAMILTWYEVNRCLYEVPEACKKNQTLTSNYIWILNKHS